MKKLILLYLLLFTPLSAAKQIALVIGNENYPQISQRNLFGPLPNPHEDAKDMKDLLASYGFQVYLLKDAGKSQMEYAVNCLIGLESNRRKCPPRYRIAAGDTVLFYYSGHGAQVWETGDYYNYLAAANRAYADGVDLQTYGLNAHWILGKLENSPAKVKLMFLDACRNRIAESGKKGMGAAGFALMQPDGALVSYAAGSNQIAWGRPRERNSLYTRYLLQTLKQQANQPISRVVKLVRDAVFLQTQKDKRAGKRVEIQKPKNEDDLIGDYCMAGCGAIALVQEKQEQQSAQPQAVPETTRTPSQAQGQRIKHYVAYANGTAVDTKTGLMWMRCVVGQRWDGATCQGAEKAMEWKKAKQQTASFAEYQDWRIPTIQELRSLVYCSNGKLDYFNQGKPGLEEYIAQERPNNFDWGCAGSPETDHENPTIVQSVFPNTPYDVWSGSPYAADSDGAWYVHFSNGNDGNDYRGSNRHVRLVRDGQ
ncbi:caspase family protein [Candidatus Venteria ishoeyi]|uniref:caspase family protein n=1 Tax=Candidatus Venteria ishoeyi TaxID=1899563 RepID=UPI0025A65636|nr:caspase family protein [Candidatus Venteria ishoeyi]MDM8546991.1 caspase family protein [Candidatus Venteria ishoeyi]